MALASRRFAGVAELEACAVDDSAHLLPGAQGSHVALVQQALIDLGEQIESGATGMYGPDTEAAVTSYKTAQEHPQLCRSDRPDRRQEDDRRTGRGDRALRRLRRGRGKRNSTSVCRPRGSSRHGPRVRRDGGTFRGGARGWSAGQAQSAARTRQGAEPAPARLDRANLARQRFPAAPPRGTGSHRREGPAEAGPSQSRGGVGIRCFRRRTRQGPGSRSGPPSAARSGGGFRMGRGDHSRCRRSAPSAPR